MHTPSSDGKPVAFHSPQHARSEVFSIESLRAEVARLQAIDLDSRARAASHAVLAARLRALSSLAALRASRQGEAERAVMSWLTKPLFTGDGAIEPVRTEERHDA